METIVGKRFVEYCGTKDMQPAQVARKLEISKQTIYSWEWGRSEPKMYHLEKILKVFPEIDLYWLITGKEIDNNSIVNEKGEKYTRQCDNCEQLRELNKRILNELDDCKKMLHSKEEKRKVS